MSKLAVKLNDLAARIVREHAAVAEALTAGLLHAREAGKLLLQAKEMVPHGDWLPWLRGNCPEVSKRTAQGYMRVASKWDELAAATGDRLPELGYREALLALADDDEDARQKRNGVALLDGPPAPVRTLLHGLLPPPLGSYLAAGLIAEEHIRHLLTFRDVYGDGLDGRGGIVREFGPGELLLEETPEEVSGLLIAWRPIDSMDGFIRRYPVPPLPASVVAGAKEFIEAANHARGRVPQWKLAAFWWGTQAVLSDFTADELGRAVELASAIFDSAWGWCVQHGGGLRDADKFDNLGQKRLLWGYQAELRHSGVEEPYGERLLESEYGFEVFGRACRRNFFTFPSELLYEKRTKGRFDGEETLPPADHDEE